MAGSPTGTISIAALHASTFCRPETWPSPFRLENILPTRSFGA